MAKDAKASQSKTALNTEDYERIGRELEDIVASGYASKKRVFLFSLAKGILTGMGSVIGASLMIVLIAWLLSGLEQVPFIGDVFENINQTIETHTSQ